MKYSFSFIHSRALFEIFQEPNRYNIHLIMSENSQDINTLTATMLALPKRPNSADLTFRQPSQSLDQVGENSEMAALERDLLIWREEKALAQKAH